MDIINELLKQFAEFVKSNQFLSGGLVVGGFSFIFNYIKNMPTQIIKAIHDFLFRTCKVTVNDALFDYVEGYIIQNKTNIKHGLGTIENKNGEQIVTVKPFEGQVKWFWFNGSFGRIFKKTPQFNRSDDNPLDSLMSMAMNQECYEIEFLSFDKTIVYKFLEFVINQIKLDDDNTIKVYKSSSHDDWERAGRIYKRELSSVIYPDNIKTTIVEDIKQFLARKDWYVSLGIPYHRGYLFHGIPGSGKTSLIHAVASHFGRNINILNLSLINDSQLLSLLESDYRNDNAIIVIEDLDCIFEQREHKEKSFVTFSGLLNALDGIITQPGTIFMCTTNHINKLDPALFRPGRLDKVFNIGHATEEQIKLLFIKFFGKDTEHEADKFAKKCKTSKLSMAKIQEFFITYSSPNDALSNIKELLK